MRPISPCLPGRPPRSLNAAARATKVAARKNGLVLLLLSLATPLSLLSTFLLRPCSAAGIQALLRIVATRNRPSSSNFFSPELAKGSLYLGGPAAIQGPGYVMRRRLRDGDSSSARPNLPLFPFLNTAFPKAAPLSCPLSLFFFPSCYFVPLRAVSRTPKSSNPSIKPAPPFLKLRRPPTRVSPYKTHIRPERNPMDHYFALSHR